METAEICPLTQEAIEALLTDRCARATASWGDGRRSHDRWPFPGTIELWIPEDIGGERHTLGTCMNLSLNGVGLRCDEDLPPGMELEIAVHQPEASFHGRAIVRHCTRTSNGDHIVGMQFVF